MEKTYEIPQKGHSTKKEREIFWRGIIEDQRASGMSIKKFCQHYHIPFAALKYRRYRVKPNAKSLDFSNREDCGSKDEGTLRFMPVQLNSKNIVTPLNDCEMPIKIFFRNGHYVEIASAKGNELSKIISLVSRLSC